VKEAIIKILRVVFPDRHLSILTELQIGTEDKELDQACIDLREDIVDGKSFDDYSVEQFI